MADDIDIDMTADGEPSCEEVRAAIDLLVLDALDPAEAARVAAHIDRCEGCRAERARAESALGSLLLMAPAVDVPDGFVDRVAAASAGTTAPSASPAPTAAPPEPPEPPEPPDPTVRPLEPGRRDRDRRLSRIVAVAAAIVIVALLVTAIGAALGTVFASNDQVAGPPTSAVPNGRTAPLVSTDGLSVGSVAVDDADRPTLVMVVDRVEAGAAYDCVVRTASGELVTVGSWTPTEAGRTSWAVPLDPTLGAVDEVRLVGPSGTTLATANLS